MEQIQQQLAGRDVRHSVAQKFAYFYWLVYAFFANFFTWLSKNKPICWCTNWNSPFILGDISLLKIAKFSLLSWHRSSKKTCIVPCFYCRPGHAFIMYAKWDPRPTCPSSRPVTFLIQVQKLNKKKREKKKHNLQYILYLIDMYLYIFPM